MPSSFLDYVKDNPVETERFKTLKRTLHTLSGVVAGRSILDFGSGCALSICALLESGVRRIVGAEPNEEHVRETARILRGMGISPSRAAVVLIPYGALLPFSDCSFEVVLANAVLERIPPPSWLLPTRTVACARPRRTSHNQ